MGLGLKWRRSGMEIAWGMEKKWWYGGNENEGCVAWKAKMDYDGGCCSLRTTEQ